MYSIYDGINCFEFKAKSSSLYRSDFYFEGLWSAAHKSLVSFTLKGMAIFNYEYFTIVKEAQSCESIHFNNCCIMTESEFRIPDFEKSHTKKIDFSGSEKLSEWERDPLRYYYLIVGTIRESPLFESLTDVYFSFNDTTKVMRKELRDYIKVCPKGKKRVKEINVKFNSR